MNVAFRSLIAAHRHEPGDLILWTSTYRGRTYEYVLTTRADRDQLVPQVPQSLVWRGAWSTSTAYNPKATALVW